MTFKVGDIVLLKPKHNGEKCPKDIEKYVTEPLVIKIIDESERVYFENAPVELEYGVSLYAITHYGSNQLKQQQFQSGMKRNDSTGKPRFDLICPLSQAYDKTLLYRWAMLLTKGMEIYSARNWERANGLAELESFKASAERHFRQAMADDTSEDHFAAVLFNLNGIVYLMDKLGCDVKGADKSSDC